MHNRVRRTVGQKKKLCIELGSSAATSIHTSNWVGIAKLRVFLATNLNCICMLDFVLTCL
jgi:hypothetical protein